MTLNIMSIETIKPVYSNEIMTIYISTNRSIEVSSEVQSDTPKKYLYSNGEFFDITSNSPAICNKSQHSFLLGLMTTHGAF